MKKLLLFVAVLGITGMSYAQGNLPKNDPEAKKVLDAVSSTFKNYKAVQATFTLKNEDPNGKMLGQKKGVVKMKGTKYHVALDGQEIFSDGKSIWTYDKSANEVTITSIDPSGDGITPQKLFTNFYDKDFLYKLNGQKSEAGKVVQEIELTPNDKSQQFHKVYVLVDKAKSQIYSTKVLDKAGNRYTYVVNTFNGSAPLSDKDFIFDAKKYPGVEEIDLR